MIAIINVLKNVVSKSSRPHFQVQIITENNNNNNLKMRSR